jgi:hypothetical protein
MPNSRRFIFIIMVFGAIGIFVVGIPVIEVHTVEPYTISEPYEVRVPYKVIEAQEDIIGSVNAWVLESGRILYWSKYLTQGTDVSLEFSATNAITAYILTPNQYNEFTGYTQNFEKRLQAVDFGSIEYFVPSSGDYYFVVYNINDGDFHESKDIVINHCSVVASWDEEVTHYRNETEYRIYTRYRAVKKKITIIEKVMGDY